MASEQAMEQHQRPDDGNIFMTVFVSVLSGIAYVEIYVSWYVQSAKYIRFLLRVPRSSVMQFVLYHSITLYFQHKTEGVVYQLH